MGLAIVKHWFGPRTFASIFVSGVAGWTTLTNMRLLMDDPVAIGTVITFLIAGLISWWIIGSDSYKAEKRDRTIDDISMKLNALYDRQNPAHVAIPLELKNLSAASSDDIRNGVQGVIADMRKFNAELRMRRMKSIPKLSLVEGQSEADRRSHWQRQTEDLLTASEAAASEFNSVHRPVALAYRDEMLRRLGLPKEAPTERSIALDLGMLAGVDPVNDAANYLEELARKLF